MKTHFPILESNGITIDKNKYTITINGKSQYISKMLFDILYYLMTHTDRVISRDEFLTEIWNNINVEMRTVDVHIKNLRNIVGKENIITVMKVGYIWKNN